MKDGWEILGFQIQFGLQFNFFVSNDQFEHFFLDFVFHPRKALVSEDTKKGSKWQSELIYLIWEYIFFKYPTLTMDSPMAFWLCVF